MTPLISFLYYIIDSECLKTLKSTHILVFRLSTAEFNQFEYITLEKDVEYLDYYFLCMRIIAAAVATLILSY